MYKDNGMTQKVFLKPYEEFQLPELIHAEDVVNGKSITNFVVPSPTSYTAIGETIDNINVRAVDSEKKIHTSQQTNGNFEIEY